MCDKPALIGRACRSSSAAVGLRLLRCIVQCIESVIVFIVTFHQYGTSVS